MNQKTSKTKLKSALIFIALIALSGCKTIEIAHEPAECLELNIPKLSETMSNETLLNMTEDDFSALELFVIRHNERHKAQCELIKRHNQAHSK